MLFKGAKLIKYLLILKLQTILQYVVTIFLFYCFIIRVKIFITVTFKHISKYLSNISKFGKV